MGWVRGGGGRWRLVGFSRVWGLEYGEGMKLVEVKGLEVNCLKGEKAYVAGIGVGAHGVE